MKRFISIVLVITLILSILTLLEMPAFAQTASDNEPFCAVGTYEEETCEPIWETEAPTEEETCEPIWETEAPPETQAPTQPPTEPPPVREEGSCGSSAYYSFDYETGALYIYGSGYVTEYSRWDWYNPYPWTPFRDKIVSLTVEGVDNVPAHAFKNCPNLESVVIGDTVKDLGQGEYDYGMERDYYYPPDTFSGCKKLKSVTLGSGITYLDGGEFSGCTALTTINLPDGLLSIGESSFSGCAALSDLDLPDGLTSIGQYAFSGCTNLSDIVLPEHLENIRPSAFSDCVSLTDINFPDTLTRIGNYAFNGCTHVKPQSFSHITYIGDYAFQNCIAVETAEFDEKVEQIGYYAFDGCTDLQSVSFTDGVDMIGDYAFSNCPALTDFTLNGELGTASYLAFEGAAFYDNEENWQDDIFYFGDNLIKVRKTLAGECVIHDGVKKIPSSAFAGCDRLESIVLPDSVTTIENYAFSNCYSLESLKLGRGLTDVGFGAFRNCPVLSTVDIPDIGEWLDISFGYTIWGGGGSGGGWSETSYTANPLYYGATLCINGKPVENLVIDNRQKIKGYQFYNCKSIKSLTLKGDVTDINAYAFFGCSRMEEVRLYENVKQIGTQAFWNCAKLKHLYIYNPNCVIYDVYQTISGVATIHGYDDSTAQMYAGNYNRSFVLIEDYLLGDADGDGTVTIIDVTAIRRHLVDIKVNNFVEEAADIDTDGIVSIMDATFIQRWLLEIYTPFRIGEKV